MAWRISKTVVRGEIDNRQHGRITGRIWLVGQNEPIELNLKGNAHRDMAGCLLTFENPESGTAEKEHTELHPNQEGTVGDMTASRKVRVLEMPVKEAYMMRKQGGHPPEHWANSLYLEWYSNRNGRVVIEGPDWNLELSEHLWELSEAQESEQQMDNNQAIIDWMDRLVDAANDQDPKDADDLSDDFTDKEE